MWERDRSQLDFLEWAHEYSRLQNIGSIGAANRSDRPRQAELLFNQWEIDRVSTNFLDWVRDQ